MLLALLICGGDSEGNKSSFLFAMTTNSSIFSVDHHNDDNEDVLESKFCTSILSGDHNLLQSLYLCKSDSNEDNKCYCEVCSVTCQKTDDDLEYIGVIPGYCDCDQSTCKNQLYEKHSSNRPLLNSKLLNRMSHEFESLFNTEKDVDNTIPSYVMTSWFNNDDFLKGCYIESNELVKHSKDTFWLNKEQKPNCYLEFMAQQVMIHHESKVPSDSELIGVEFWVQVKPWVQEVEQQQQQQHKSIGLHYDKDENLAEDFNIGVYPYISTVTYLTTGGASTIIVSNMQQSPIGTPIGEITVSHAVKSKHICFNGTLLHGAPYIEQLNAPRPTDNNDGYDDLIVNESKSRVTFLVNLWVDHKPLRVDSLPTNIREKLKASSIFESNSICIDDVGFKRQNESI